MKTLCSKVTRFLCLLGLAAWGMASDASGQSSAGLAIQLYPGLTITGTVGTVYSVQSMMDLTQTETESSWRCVEFLQLPASPYLWTDKSAPTTSRRFYRAVEFAAATNLVFIPPGTFRMGSPTNEADRLDIEGPQMEVTISQGFWLGKYEVTQGEYLAVMGTNPSGFNGDHTATGGLKYGTDLNRPVEMVSSDDATAYCLQLTQRELEAGRIAARSAFRLPTEAEWEYACRAWTSTRFSYGNDPGYTDLTNYAWYTDNGGDTTHPVGQKLPNLWGLHDMHGNVWEWCLGEGNGEGYPGGIALDPDRDAQRAHVRRGGSWGTDGGTCRSALRDGFGQGFTPNIGFRVLLAPDQR